MCTRHGEKEGRETKSGGGWWVNLNSRKLLFRWGGRKHSEKWKKILWEGLSVD